MACSKGKAYSDDLRWRIVQMKAVNASDSDIAAQFMVSKRTVQRYVERFAVTGTVAPFQRRNGPLSMLSSSHDLLMQSILDRPTLYLHEMQQELEAQGVSPSLSTISRYLSKMGITRKRVKQLAEQQNEASRLSFMAEMSIFDPTMIIWLDETGCDKRNAARQYGYSLRGIAPRSYTFKSGGKRYTQIMAMSTDGVEDMYIAEGNIDGERFLKYVQRSLLPLLMPFNGTNPKSVVVMDNASIHHVEEVVDTIQSVGALVRFLPPYSPDLNPCEEVFAQVKSWIKSNDIVFQATRHPSVLIAMAYGAVTTHNCLSYIRDSGYM